MGNPNANVLSTRARLARNIQGYPFSRCMDTSQKYALQAQIAEAFKETDFSVYTMEELSGEKRTALMEQHFISPDLAKKDEGMAIVSRDGCISIMVNEEDHIRIQSFSEGFALKKALSVAVEMDEMLQQRVTYVTDRVLGYLTTCPTNVGTGLRMSAMVHLPATTMAGRMKQLQIDLRNQGITVRGMYGEGSGAAGCIYQISNNVTLGVTEEEIAMYVEKAVLATIERETELKTAIQNHAGLELADRSYRAYGLLTHARKLNWQEFMSLWSDCNMASDLLELETGILKELLVAAQPGQLMMHEKGSLEALRADVVRRMMKQAIQKTNREE